MAIKGIDEINITDLGSGTTDTSDPTYLLDFIVNTAGIPFAEMFVMVISVIVFVAMKSQDFDTLECLIATTWLSSVLSGMFLLLGLISEAWLIGSMSLAALSTFGLWFNNRE